MLYWIIWTIVYVIVILPLYHVYFNYGLPLWFFAYSIVVATITTRHIVRGCLKVS